MLGGRSFALLLKVLFESLLELLSLALALVSLWYLILESVNFFQTNTGM